MELRFVASRILIVLKTIQIVCVHTIATNQISLKTCYWVCTLADFFLLLVTVTDSLGRQNVNFEGPLKPNLFTFLLIMKICSLGDQIIRTVSLYKYIL